MVNSYVRPQVAKYIENLQASLTERLGEDTQLSILRSDGGLASGRAAAENPVNMLMSGPAGGVAGAMYFCSRAGFDDILTFDMGGTSRMTLKSWTDTKSKNFTGITIRLTTLFSCW